MANATDIAVMEDALNVLNNAYMFIDFISSSLCTEEFLKEALATLKEKNRLMYIHPAHQESGAQDINLALIDSSRMMLRKVLQAEHDFNMKYRRRME